MKFTPATINKKIKQLQEKKERLEAIERDSKTYICAVNEEPVIPEYDYKKISENIRRINREIVILKHALNQANLEATVWVDEGGFKGAHTYTVDQILIELPQLNNRKNRLEKMINEQPKTRINNTYSRTDIIEYEYINYNLEDVRRDYEEIDNRITSMQLALDKHNQTYEFEVHGLEENI